MSRRFADTDLAGRDKIMKADFMIFLENPLFGVGPGESYELHALTYRPSSAHTEYTRLLAEHGMFGVLVIVLPGSMAWSRWRATAPPLEKGVALGLTAWVFLYMGHSAMRLAAPALLFGLGGALLLLDASRGLSRPCRASSRRETWRR